jgi:gluconate 2-dehydrogenase gamma chain
MPERELPTDLRELDPAIESPSSGLNPSSPPSTPLSLFERHQGQLTRRRLLATSAASGAALGLSTMISGAHAQDATPEATPGMDMPMDMHDADMNPQHANTNTGFVAFVPYQITLLRAACSRLIPTDDSGPGAEEAGVVYFIDREVGSHKYYRGRRYTQGPFLAGEATQGDQSLLTMQDRFRIGLESMDAYAKATYNGTGFADLTTDQQDQVLTDMQSGKVDAFGSISIDSDPLTPMATGGQPGISAAAFFSLLLSYTQAGYFADPVHGGNRDMVGWKLIGFPGAHLSWADQIENYNQPFQGDYISLGQYQEQVGGES